MELPLRDPEPSETAASAQAPETFVEGVRRRFAEKRARLAPAPEPPGSDDHFEEKYRYLADGLRRTFEAVGEPGLEVDTFGSSGLRIAFRVLDPHHGDSPVVDREVRISRVDATGEVHLVFSSWQRAERHATFKLARPQLPRLEAALVDFLVEGIEPRWLDPRRRRRSGDRGAPDEDAAARAGAAAQRSLEFQRAEPGVGARTRRRRAAVGEAGDGEEAARAEDGDDAAQRTLDLPLDDEAPV
ncbi:MAG TPA: hypothetical protein VIC56_00935 [Gemmatimonadota bacterium]